MSLNAEQILKLKAKGWSNRQIAKEYYGSDSKEYKVRRILKKNIYKITKEVVRNNPTAKIFLGDVEVSPTLAWSFKHFKAFILPEAVEQHPYILTWAGKWLGNPAIISHKLPDYPTFDTDITNDYELVLDLWHILDACDIFIAHNARFDKGWANQRFAYHQLPPPSPYVVIDTYAAAKQEFSLPSNSLKYSCDYFELENRKRTNEGMALWVRCCKGDKSAFEEMEYYNIGDIPTLEDLYLLVRPFMRKHPNVAVFADDSVMRCVKCGSDQVNPEEGKVGTTYLSKFQAYRCSCCGSVMRDRFNIRTKDQMYNTLTTVL